MPQTQYLCHIESLSLAYGGASPQGEAKQSNN